MNILRSLLYTTAILLASITAVAGSFILFAEFTGPELYVYAQGTVVRILPDTSQGDIALVHFTTKQHISIEFQIPDAFPHYRIGATLPVKYKPESPSDAYDASFAANGLLGVVLLWFSLLCIALISGPLLFRRYVWRQVAISIRLQRRQV
jgi:hypothetical protein